jgi:hypothetical protein
MRIESLPAYLPGPALAGLLLAIALVAMALLLLGADVNGAGAAQVDDVRLAPFRWNPNGGNFA